MQPTGGGGNQVAAREARDAYKGAMLEKQAWRAFMEPPSKHMEALLHQKTGLWGGQCIACQIDMTRGISDHFPSQNHWKKLWERLNRRVPESDIAHNWGAQWVQKFDLPDGCYLFNLLTGDHGYAEQVKSSADAPPTPAPASSSAANAQVRAAPRSVDCRETSKDVALPATFDLASWVWEQHIRDGASKLNEAIAGQGHTVTCSVCDTATDNILAHLTGTAHFRKLQERAPGAVKVATRVHEEGPWVQEFEHPEGTIMFNHITGKIQLAPLAEVGVVENC